MSYSVSSWNKIPRVRHCRLIDFSHRQAEIQLFKDTQSYAVYGNGRSYGDVCLNDGGALIRTRGLHKFISFNSETGTLICEAGVLLSEILSLVVPQGWFLKVTPGTRFVTVGGAICNDVHGKNHFKNGSFGNHVISFELLRTDRTRLICDSRNNSEWFHATIGGLGLTGLITWAELQLMPISSEYMLTNAVKFANLDEFWRINAELESIWPYTVAWIDCLATGRKSGRGIYFAGKHTSIPDNIPKWKPSSYSIPIEPSFSLVNNFSLRLFNNAYFHRPITQNTPQTSHYMPYFYPLDAIKNWNCMYGKKGFYQYQCVIPKENSREGISAMLERIAKRKEGSFLAVLKTFGQIPSNGLISFAREGTTLALDFPNRGARTDELLDELDTIVAEAGGALYPAKDARMSSQMFRLGFPKWEQFAPFIDPKFSSSFWRRVEGK